VARPGRSPLMTAAVLFHVVGDLDGVNVIACKKNEKKTIRMASTML